MRSAVSAALAMHGGGAGGGGGGGGGGARERWLGARGAAMLSVVFVLLRRARRETRDARRESTPRRRETETETAARRATPHPAGKPAREYSPVQSCRKFSAVRGHSSANS